MKQFNITLLYLSDFIYRMQKLFYYSVLQNLNMKRIFLLQRFIEKHIFSLSETRFIFKEGRDIKTIA
jgi:hypothetical protein